MPLDTLTHRISASLLAILLLCGCAHSPPDDPRDPLEPMNRVVFSINSTLDKYALRPAAKGYVAVVPSPVRQGINNFFANLFYPRVVVGNLLQGKPKRAASDAARFLINTTIGLVGIFDVATPMGLERHHEDSGQTFGVWGIGPGWYLVLPFYGPSTNRDLVGRVVDAQLNPLNYADDDVQLAGTVIFAIDTRSRFLGADRLIEDAFDPYLFVRGAYLERRASMIEDGRARPAAPIYE